MSTILNSNCPFPAQHNYFLNLLDDHGLSQIVEKPTRGDNILGLICINNVTLVNRYEILPGSSDHEAVFTEIDIRPKHYKQAKRKIPLYKSADWDKIAEVMSSTNEYIQARTDSESTTQLWNKLKSDLHNAIEEHIRHKTCSSRDKSPCITTKVRKLIKQRRRLFRKTKHATCKRKEDIEGKIRSLKHKIQQETRSAYWSYVEKIILPESPEYQQKGGNKQLWSFIKHRKVDSVEYCPLKG